ncbi:hypothetical protein Q3G72_008911 [Acer saccharum]|nr:hypothetical protein Q3G72_008911 [Acer saccharum]
MENCNISGDIPEEIGNLNKLMTLRLANNQLTGPIPVTFKRLQKLQGLSLENNKLEGSIPNDLCHLNRLVILYLDNNKLSGSIPPCLGMMCGGLSVVFNTRDTNSFADNLAKMGSGRSGDRIQWGDI